MTKFATWFAAVAALGLGTKSTAKAPAPRPAVPEGRCQKYFESGAGYTLLEKVRGPQLKFGFELHAKLAGKGTGNQLTSPFSAYAVLGLLAAGAKGATQEELQKLLFGTVALDEGIEGIAATVAALECPNEYRSTALTSANRLFVGKDVQVLPDYAEKTRSRFNTTTGLVDFAKSAEAAATINRWVSDETRGNIPELVGEHQLDPSTRLILVNALYVLGTWAEKFDAKNTKPKPFHLENGKTIKVATMHQRHEMPTFLYAKRPKYEALVMDFADHLVDVVFLLPDRTAKLAAVMGGLDGTEWGILEKKWEKKPIDLAVPKFKLNGSGSLVEALKALGLRDSFVAGKAKFDGIDGGKNLLYVGEVLQKTTAKADELGFEGSAATAAMMYAGSAPPKPAPPIPFVVDRPFAFVVLHRPSGALLFVGEVREPK